MSLCRPVTCRTYRPRFPLPETDITFAGRAPDAPPSSAQRAPPGEISQHHAAPDAKHRTLGRPPLRRPPDSPSWISSDIARGATGAPWSERVSEVGFGGARALRGVSNRDPRAGRGGVVKEEGGRKVQWPGGGGGGDRDGNVYFGILGSFCGEVLVGYGREGAEEKWWGLPASDPRWARLPECGSCAVASRTRSAVRLRFHLERRRHESPKRMSPRRRVGDQFVTSSVTPTPGVHGLMARSVLFYRWRSTCRPSLNIVLTI